MTDVPDAPSGPPPVDDDAARLMPRPRLPGPGDAGPGSDATQAIPRRGVPVAAPRSASAAHAAPGGDRTSVLPRPPVEGTAVAPRPQPSNRRPPPPRPPARPAPRRAAPVPQGPRRPRRWKRWVGLVVVVGLALPVLLLGYAWVQWNRIERVDVSGVLSSGGSGTNYLIVGSDTREGIDPDDPNAGAFLAGEVSGERTDTIMVLRVEGDRSFLLSIPRDLWVTNAATGEQGRINAVYRSGPAALIQTVQQSVGIPVHRYLEIDFVSFAGLVDAVGGITIDFPNPARDEKSGLDIQQPGPATLDGTQALAYVRSRTYTELVDGEYRTDPTGDIGRTERQRQFLSALLGQVTASRNPLELMRISSSLGGGVRIDDGFTFLRALGLSWNLRDGFDPESVVLPTTPRRTSGGADVLDVDAGAAESVLAQFSA